MEESNPVTASCPLKYYTYSQYADQGRTIRVPFHMGDQINKFLRAQHQLTQRLGHEPTVAEVAEALELPINWFQLIILDFLLL